MLNIKRSADPLHGGEQDSKKFKFVPATSVQLKRITTQLNCKTQVKILYWNSPHEFSVQAADGFSDYENMMRRIQIVYNKGSSIWKNDQAAIGDYVVAKNRNDNFWYRAKITDYQPQLKKYKLEFVDVGNCQITAEEEVHVIEEEFTKLPIMAIKVSLDNIVSCTDNANLTSNLNQYITQESVIYCEFLRPDGDRYYATIRINNKDLKTSLMDDKYVMDLPKTINLKVLVGQTMKLQLVNITSLLHFYACFDGVLVPCCYYNAQRAKIVEKFINFRQNLEKKCCVARILNLTNTNTLMVSISCLNDFTEPIYRSVPVLTEKMAITVDKVEDFNVLWVRLSSYGPQFADFLKEMNQFYQNQVERSSSATIQMNTMYACKSSIDNNWYRGKILNNSTVDELQFEFIDFGRTESIQKEDIRTLGVEFKYVSTPILKLYLPYQSIDESQRQMIINEVTALTSGYGLTLNLIRAYKNVYIGSVSHLDVSMEQVLIYKQLVVPIDINKMYEIIDTKEPAEVSLLIVPCNFERCVLGYISHVIDPENLYVQLKSDETLLEEMVSDLQLSVPKLKPLEAVDIGMDCYSFCIEYTSWYRAQITGIDGETITVQYVDYGNTEEVTIDKLRENPSEPFVPFARLCALPVCSKEMNRWHLDAVSLLKALIGEEIYFETLESQNDRIYINLCSKTENLTQFLVDNNFANFVNPKDVLFNISVKAIQDGVMKIGVGLVQVVLFLSCREFYIQFKESLPALNTLGELLASTDFAALRNPQVGDIIAARFTDDHLLYRAKVIGPCEVDGMMVHFIDYGNTTIATEFRMLPDKLKTIAPFVWTCSFEDTDSVDKVMLEEYLFEENAFFLVEELDKLHSNGRIVRLLKEGNNVLDLFTKSQEASQCEEKTEIE